MLFSEQRIKNLILHTAILYSAVSKERFPPESGFLKNATRRPVIRERECVQPHERKFFKGMNRNGFERFGDNPVAPKSLAEPVPRLSRVPVYIVLDIESDAANGQAIYRYGEVGFGLFVGDVLKPGCRIVQGVRVRETVSELQPDLSVVGMMRETRSVAGAP
jgi:hypothetical protein